MDVLCLNVVFERAIPDLIITFITVRAAKGNFTFVVFLSPQVHFFLVLVLNLFKSVNGEIRRD